MFLNCGCLIGQEKRSQSNSGHNFGVQIIFGSEETCERVDDEAEDHGDDGDEDPVREPLVLHAAIDGNGRLVALEQKHRQENSDKSRSAHLSRCVCVGGGCSSHSCL